MVSQGREDLDMREVLQEEGGSLVYGTRLGQLRLVPHIVRRDISSPYDVVDVGVVGAYVLEHLVKEGEGGVARPWVSVLPCK